LECQELLKGGTTYILREIEGVEMQALVHLLPSNSYTLECLDCRHLSSNIKKETIPDSSFTIEVKEVEVASGKDIITPAPIIKIK